MNRRSLLACVGCVGGTLLSGCSALPGGSGGDGSSGSHLSGVENWLVPRDTGDEDRFSVNVVAVGDVTSADSISGDEREYLLGAVPSGLGLAAEDVDRTISVRPMRDDPDEYVVVDGAVDPAAIEASITLSSEADPSTVQGYRLLPRADGPWLAVGDGRLVVVPTSFGASEENRGRIELVLETQAELRTPYLQQSESAASVVDRSSAGIRTQLIAFRDAFQLRDRPDRLRFGGWDARARTVSVDGDGRYTTELIHHFTEGALDEETLQEGVDLVSDTPEYDASLDVDGQFATITLTAPTVYFPL